MRADMDRRGIALGMAFGLILGAATGHIGLGFALGASSGLRSPPPRQRVRAGRANRAALTSGIS